MMYCKDVSLGAIHLLRSHRGGEGGFKNFPKLRTAVLIGCVKCELSGEGARSMYLIEIQSRFSQYWPSVMSFWLISICEL